MRTVSYFMLLSWQFIIHPAYANEMDPKSINEAIEISGHKKGRETMDIMDDIHGVVSEKLIVVSDRIDNFFVGERMDVEGSNTQFLLGYLISEDLDGNLKNDYLVKARLNFPKTQNRLRLVIESTTTQEKEDEEDPLNRVAREESRTNFSTALQFVFTKTKFWQITTKTGIRFVIPPDPFSQLRIRRLFLKKDWIIRFVETLFVSRTEGIGESTTVDLERDVNKNLFFRSRSSLKAAQKIADVNYTQEFSMFQPVNLKEMLVYSIGYNGSIETPRSPSVYFINFRFRHSVYKKWAYYEVVPSISFDRKNGFSPVPAIFFRFDVIFGKI